MTTDRRLDGKGPVLLCWVARIEMRGAREQRAPVEGHPVRRDRRLLILLVRQRVRIYLRRYERAAATSVGCT